MSKVMEIFESLDDLLKELELHPFLVDSNPEINLTNPIFLNHFPKELKDTIQFIQTLLYEIAVESETDYAIETALWLFGHQNKYKLTMEWKKGNELISYLHTPKGIIEF